MIISKEMKEFNKKLKRDEFFRDWGNIIAASVIFVAFMAFLIFEFSRG